MGRRQIRWCVLLILPAIFCQVGGWEHSEQTVWAAAKEPNGFQLPPGFTIEKVAGPPLVEHPMMGTFDERGRLFVAEAAGQNLKAADLLKVLPNFIRVLEPADGAGFFHKSQVFADKMSFPMGVLWHEGSLYTASPPSLWRLTDSKNTGVADQREELVTRFNFIGNAADIHGPFLGPDGRFYWCDGRHGHEIRRPDGTTMKGKAARIFRCRPDGSEVEVVCGGGMDNPVETVFTPEGEAFATVNILHARPARNDGIIYGIEGGVWPWHEVYKEFPRTGELLPAIADLGWVAPSGLMRYRSDTLGKEYQGNLFSAQFNRNRIQRHIVARQGAGFGVKTEDFLVSSDKNFHPTDVLEDADGSLLVLDTGGWFRIGCPTSQIARPEIKGGIYRIRKKPSPLPLSPRERGEDARGLNLTWDKMSAEELAGLLDDPRFTVRDRAVQQLSKHEDALPALQRVLATAVSPRACRNAVWALTRMDTPKARTLIRRVLGDKDLSVRLAATHAVALQRDDKAMSQLLTMVVRDEHPAVRRNAATALGRLRDAKAVSAIIEALRLPVDRYLEHALIYALIQIDNRQEVAVYLKDQNPGARRAALVALDQMPSGNLTREEVIPLLSSDDEVLLQIVLGVIANRPGWGPEIVGLLRNWLALAELDAAKQESVRGLLVGLGKDKAIQELVAQTLQHPRTAAATRVLVLEAMARVAIPKLPAAWLTELGRALNHVDGQVVTQAVSTARALNLPNYDKELQALAGNTQREVELRLAAFAAAAPRLKQVDPTLFAFLVKQLDQDKPPLVKLSAANALTQAGLDRDQLLALVKVVSQAGALELPVLLGAFEKSGQAAVGNGLAVALDKAPGLSGVTATALERTFKNYPEAVRQEASRLLKRLEADSVKDKVRLAQLEPLLQGGDEGRGKLVFYGTKASCSACHAVGGAGGKFGPELSKIGAVRSGRDLLEAVIFPSASFARGYEPYVVEKRNGKIVSGIIGRDTPDALYLVTTDRAEVRIQRADIETFAPSRASIMPQGLDAQLTAQELRDLLAYLQGLR